jgi:LacI family transcriptional regulator
VVAAFDQLELSELLRVPVRVYASDPRGLGRTAARMLFERLDGEVTGEARAVVMVTPAVE